MLFWTQSATIKDYIRAAQVRVKHLKLTVFLVESLSNAVQPLCGFETHCIDHTYNAVFVCVCVCGFFLFCCCCFLHQFVIKLACFCLGNILIKVLLLFSLKLSKLFFQTCMIMFTYANFSLTLKVNGQKLETVTSFKYLGSVITDESSKPEIFSRIAQTTAALTRLKPVWIDKSISLSSKIRLMRSLVISISLYACESWTLTAVLQRRTQAMELRCYCKILHISYKDHVTNEEIRAKIQQAIRPHKIS